MTLLHNRLARTTALIVAAGFAAHAAGDGNISITVKSPSGQPVSGATVSVSSPNQIGGARTLNTDSAGRVRFVKLTPGRFKVMLSASGFQSQTLPAVEVLVDQTAGVNFQMIPVGAATVEVISSISAVDVTTVTTGIQLTQDEFQSLPIARTQMAAITLAPGVVDLGTGNPVLSSGLGQDNFGNNGGRNNTYMIDGLDVTNPETGTGRTNLPPELILSQDIKTGAITAEYSARAGLFSNVTTTPGSNEYSGGLTFQRRWDSAFRNEFSRGTIKEANHKIDDTTLFVSGPIIKDKLWFVLSHQEIKDTFTVSVNPASAVRPGESRSSTDEESNTFAKLTWQIAPGHQAWGSFSRNPREFDTADNVDTQTRRLQSVERGGERYMAAYSWQSSNFILEVKAGRHEESDNRKALFNTDGPQVTKRFQRSEIVPINDREFGNSAALSETLYQRDLFRADGTLLFDFAGSHTLKGGIQIGKDQNTDLVGIGQGVLFQTLDQARTYGEVTTAGATGYAGSLNSSFAGVRSAINSQAQYASVRTFLDTDQDGTVSVGELRAYQFNTLHDASRPELGIDGYRFIQVESAKSTPKMEYQGAYVQDQWQFGRVTFSPGVRMDNYEYKADNGVSLFKASNNVAPRLGFTWDVNGDGRTKASAYWGRYIDPIKLDMVGFTGSLTSSIRHEQVLINNTWVTSQVRGGSGTIDAAFADNFKLPKTEELRLGFSKDFGTGWSLDVVGTYRRDYDIVEDWAPLLYTDKEALEDEYRSLYGLFDENDERIPLDQLTAIQQKNIAAFRALALDPGFFAGGGFTGQQNVDRQANHELGFVLANLPGGFRLYRTVDITLNRQFKDNWGGYLTYSRVKATGNSVSSGDADFQGDAGQYDPRLPWNNGTLPGSIDWQTKGYAYYKWDSGFLVGLTGTWNSGYHYNKNGDFAFRRILLEAPEDGDFLGTEHLGNAKTPQIHYFDLRLQYGRKIYGKVKGEVYMDVRNLFNEQRPRDLAETNSNRGSFASGQPYSYLLPRNFIFGIRVTF